MLKIKILTLSRFFASFSSKKPRYIGAGLVAKLERSPPMHKMKHLLYPLPLFSKYTPLTITNTHYTLNTPISSFQNLLFKINV